MNTTDSAASLYLAQAQSEATRLPSDCVSAERRRVEQVAVIGGGTMGAGIAMNFADNGIPVTLLEMDEPALQRALERVNSTYAASRERGRLSEEEMAGRISRIHGSTTFTDLAAADLVVEAVFEDINVKRDLFARLDSACKPGAILATNTSYQDVNAIAAATHRQGDVLGMHYFSPANVMKLLEVVRAKNTAPEVIATVMHLAQRIRKVSVLVGVCYGFAGNRMLTPYSREVQMLLLEGATPAQVDAAMVAFGMAMGPCSVSDLAGLDISYKARQARTDLPKDPRYFRIGNMLVENGRLGQKNGKGFYLYAPGKRERHIDPEVEAMIRAEAALLGITQRQIDDSEIVERLVYALINEGARVLAEGIAQRAGDIDVIYTNGYGFPAARGGPMYHADSVGLGAVYRKVCALRDRADTAYWEPAPLLRELAEAGVSFADWQRN